jgi:hypothetical protein
MTLGDLKMTYIEPQTVCAPRASVRAVEIIYNEGSGKWSVARVNWEDEDRIGIRWNGGDGPGVGNPQSRGRATWFIVPEPLQQVVLEKVEELSISGPGGLVEKYTEMSNDRAREREAEEWSEGLIGDASAEG